MNQKATRPTRSPGEPGTGKKDNTEGYPEYPESEDVYNKFREEKEINPEDISSAKQPNEEDQAVINRGMHFSVIGPVSDLDVPGAELDDDQETIGSEDEENNYYSLGGDGHSDLDETKID